MEITANNWKNKGGTGGRSCNCGTWKQHWINFSGQPWPSQCSVLNCYRSASLGAHIYNSSVNGEYIVPACDECNKLTGEFSLKGGVNLVSANKAETCEK